MPSSLNIKSLEINLSNSPSLPTGSRLRLISCKSQKNINSLCVYCMFNRHPDLPVQLSFISSVHNLSELRRLHINILWDSNAAILNANANEKELVMEIASFAAKWRGGEANEIRGLVGVSFVRTGLLNSRHLQQKAEIAAMRGRYGNASVYPADEIVAEIPTIRSSFLVSLRNERTFK